MQKDWKPCIIIQARMNSTRLPGKVTLPLYEDETVLDHLLIRLKRFFSSACNTVVATPPDLVTEQPIHDICRKHNVGISLGSETDLIQRYFHAAQKFKADPIIRITSDCPMLDPRLIDDALVLYDSVKTDYFTNAPIELGSYESLGYPSGFNVEVLSFDALKRLDEVVKEPSLREHVTAAIRDDRYLGQFQYHALVADEKHQKMFKGVKLSIDTPEDYERVYAIVNAIYPDVPGYSVETAITQYKSMFFDDI